MTSPINFSEPIRIIQYAYWDAGLIPEGEMPTSDRLASGMNRLIDMINFWATQGLKLWTYLDQSITLTAGTQSYLLGPTGSIISDKPMRAIQGYYLDSSNVRRPIYPLSWDEWLRLSQTSVQGAISQYFVDKQQTDLVVYFWLIPDTTAATGTAHLLIPRKITNFTGLTDTINFPPEWFIALRWGLADELAVAQPDAIVQRCQQRAIMYRTALEDWDVEDAPTKFEPDTSRGASGSMRSFV